MTDWPKVKITDLVTHVRAQAVLNDESHYELWSIPSFEFQTPERVLGTSIQSGKFLLRSDDVLLGKINPRINRVWVVSEPSISISQIGSTEWIVLRPKSSLLDSHYLAYYLRSPKFRDVFTASVTGTTGSHTRGKPVVALEYLIPLPPLDEQKRIVAKLDEALDGIDAAAQNVLNSLAAAIDFSESLLEEMLLMSGDWQRFTLSELIGDGLIVDHMDGNHGGDYPRKSEFVGSGVPYITAKAIIDDRIELDRAKFLSPNRAAQLRKGFAADGDVIFAHNATVGPVAILRTDEPTVVLGTSLTYYRCDISRLWPAYLAHSMRSRGFVRQYQQVMRQSTRNQVPITMQRTFTHVVPPLSKQQEIAARLDLAEAHSARIRKVYESMLMQLTELRAAFMAQAFNGDL